MPDDNAQLVADIGIASGKGDLFRRLEPKKNEDGLRLNVGRSPFFIIDCPLSGSKVLSAIACYLVYIQMYAIRRRVGFIM